MLACVLQYIKLVGFISRCHRDNMLACCMQKRGKKRPPVGWEMKYRIKISAQHVHQHVFYCPNGVECLLLWLRFFKIK